MVEDWSTLRAEEPVSGGALLKPLLAPLVAELQVIKDPVEIRVEAKCDPVMSHTAAEALYTAVVEARDQLHAQLTTSELEQHTVENMVAVLLKVLQGNSE